jgi:hypothetical protein
MEDEQGTWICWSVLQQMKRADRDSITHAQGEDGHTVCGIRYGLEWDFSYNDVDWAGTVGCIRCRSILRQRDSL